VPSLGSSLPAWNVPYVCNSEKGMKLLYSNDMHLDIPIYKAPLRLAQQAKSMRWQIWMGFKKGFIASYQGTVLGVIWALIMPLIPLGVYVLLASIKVIKTADHMPFVIYIIVGMVLYLFFTGTMISVIDAVNKEKGILKKVKYPLFAVMLSNFVQVVFDLIIRCIFLMPVMIFFEITPSIGSLMVIPLMIVGFLLFFSIGMILSIINIIYKDVKNFIDIIIRYALFFSSVIFSLPSDGLIGQINRFNPFNTLIVSIRDWFVLGSAEISVDILVWAALAVLLFLVACKITYAMDYRVREYL
jgi:lipopolysaccharide transport system permease protein